MNAIVRLTSFLTLWSKTQPTGTSKNEAAKPLGNAE